jgi:hypothetical protein
MSLDPSPVLGRMIRGAIMDRINDPYYGAGMASDYPYLNKIEKAGKRILKFSGAGKKRKGGMIHGDDDDEGADFSGGQVCASRPYMGYPGNVGSGYSGGKKRKPKPKRKSTKVGRGISGGKRKSTRSKMSDEIRSLKAKLGMGYSGGKKRKAPKRKSTRQMIGMGSSGGKKPKRKVAALKKAAKKNPWLIHLAKVRRQYPNESVGAIAQIASQSY